MRPYHKRSKASAEARYKEMDRLGVGLREYDSMKLGRKLARKKAASKKASRRTTR